MSIIVIANPAAKLAGSLDREAIVRRLRMLSPVEVIETAGRGHAIEIGRRCAQAGQTEVMIALGGDGTINEVVNGILSAEGQVNLPTLGVLPAGGTNVFTRALGFPNNVQYCTEMLVKSIDRGHSKLINLGVVNGRFFTFSSGLGFDAAVLEAVERRRGLGQPSSLAMTVKIASRILFLTAWPELSLTYEGVIDCGTVQWLIVANCDPWTYANKRPLRPAPDASLELGLDLYGRAQVNLLGLGLATSEMMRKPSETPKRGVYRRHDIDSFTVAAPEPVPMHADGEFLGRDALYSYRTARGVINVFIPF